MARRNIKVKYDYGRELNRKLASLDQQLQVFRDYYDSLNGEKRQALVNWVQAVSAPFPNDVDSYICMLSDIGLDEDRQIGVEIEVTIGNKTAKVLPQYLRQALEAWHRGETFIPPLGFDLW